MPHYAYMLICSDNTIYSGYTTDLNRRLKTHNSGKGAKYTRSRLPVSLGYFEEFETKSEAMKREAEFKTLPHSQKCEMIKNAGDEKASEH